MSARFVCPVCQTASKDEPSLRFCAVCSDYTGMCSAGRKAWYPGALNVVNWHVPCTNPAASKWQIEHGEGKVTIMLCTSHDREVTSGAAPWIRGVRLMAPPAGARRRRRAGDKRRRRR